MRDDGPAAGLVPRLVVSDGSRVEELERFSHYVARQIGFDHANECPHLCTLAYDYLRKNKGYEENIFAFFQNTLDPESLIVKFIEELDKCILGYFSFHWKCSTYMITQVLTVEGAPKRKLRNMVLEATRNQRFERVTRNLKVTRLFSTLVEELKAIGLSSHDQAHCSDVMVPAAHCDRSPVLLLMGGGMGAGKSTVLKDILKEAFWSGAAASAVVVEADAFKETDVIYRAISSLGHHNDMLQTAELVHQSSMDAASSLLVTALNEGRDVIMDGTLSWEPFFQQTVAMARAVHRQRYRMGVGYKVTEDGTITEDYWEPVEVSSTIEESDTRTRKPYRIELVGVVCDAYLAVVRGISKCWKISAYTCTQNRERYLNIGIVHWKESGDHRESSEGEVPAEVSQAICHRIPPILRPCRQREALQHQLHGRRKVDRVEGRREQPTGGPRGDRLPGEGEQPERRGQLRPRALPGGLAVAVGVAGSGRVAVAGVGAAGAHGRHPDERGALPGSVGFPLATDQPVLQVFVCVSSVHSLVQRWVWTGPELMVGVLARMLDDPTDLAP